MPKLMPTLIYFVGTLLALTGFSLVRLSCSNLGQESQDRKSSVELFLNIYRQCQSCSWCLINPKNYTDSNHGTTLLIQMLLSHALGILPSQAPFFQTLSLVSTTIAVTELSGSEIDLHESSRILSAWILSPCWLSRYALTIVTSFWTLRTWQLQVCDCPCASWQW